MFGYIAPVLNALNEEQKKRYRSVYCGVCHALARRTGSIGRITLSNDMTFLALLLSSLYDPETQALNARCGVHPLKTHDYLRNAFIDYAADMNLLLSSYKFRDQWMDDRALSGKLGLRSLRRTVEELTARYPLQTGTVDESLNALWSLEKENSPDPDQLCNLCGRMLGAVFVPDADDFWAGELYAVGEGLGRFIYWMDAWEDYDADQKRKRFNPLKVFHEREDYEDFCKETLELLIAEAAEHFETLPLTEDLDLLRNVMYSGVWQRYTLLNNRKGRKEQHAE